LKRVPAYRAFRRAQSGASLIVLAMILVLGTLGALLGALNVATSNTTAAKRAKSGQALAEAKLALLGYAAAQASTDNYPGRLPCPEAAGYYGDAANEGVASGFCTLPAVGRLPWRTLGLSKLTDGYGEPLWYVVSPGFALPSSMASVSINSNTAAQLTLDGTDAAAVALIIAPGAPMNVQSATGCTARVQSRSNSPPDLRDYLECENASTEATGPYKFATSGPSTSFNDQVVKMTHAELFSAVEPVVAKRIETQIAPVLKTVYAGSNWSTSTTNPVFPSAVTFTDPSSGTLTWLGTSGTSRGLLPMFRTATDPTRVVWYPGSDSTGRPTVSMVSGSGNLISSSCSSLSSTSTTVFCSVRYVGSIRIQIRAWARRVARSMRQLDPAAVPLTWADPVSPALSVFASFIPSTTSDAYVYVQANLQVVSGATDITVTFPIEVLADHPLTDPNDTTTGWFVKNNWHHLVYYAFASNFLADGTHTCANPCLTVTNLAPTGKQRAILIFAGRALGAQTRPSGNQNDYFEDPENYDSDRTYVKPAISKITNDRVVVVDANP